MTSAGNQEQIKKAKDLMTSAIIGLIIIVLAYSVSYFVVGKLSSVSEKTGDGCVPSAENNWDCQ
jgi:uncharacterized membrane protein YwzB